MTRDIDPSLSPVFSPDVFFESLPAPAYFCGPDGRIGCFNRLAVELWGRTPDCEDPTIRYSAAFELRSSEGALIAPEESPTALVLRDGESRDGGLLVVVRPDGSQRTVASYARPINDAAGRVAGVTTVLVDVTDRLATEAALRESERNLRGFFESAAIGAVQTNMQGRFVRVNDRFCELTGYSRDELLAMSPFDLDHPDEIEADRARVTRFTADENGVYRAEKRYIRKDGRTIWVQVAAQLLRDDAGKPIQSAAIAFDITERKRFEQALQQADRMKDEFLSMLAHELRNPLAPLSNSVELLKHRAQNDEPIFDVMERQVNHLSRLVGDLLDIARMTKDRLELRKERVSLMPILEAAIEASRVELETNRQDLVTALQPGLDPHLDADPVRLTQVFTNLLLNAAKFTDRPGVVRMTITEEGGLLRVAVADSGIGMTREDLERLFEKFYQSPNQKGRAKAGLGIGLALARRLVEMHGGTITAASAGLGRGSQFVVRLPLANTASPAQTATATRERPVNRKRILILDDNRDAADSLCRLLNAMGHTATAAYDGRAGLEAARRQVPDLVLLDLGMPEWDGFEVFRRMRAEIGLADTRIVALTGWGREEDRVRTQRAGFEAHLVKPADVKAIDAVLEQTRETARVAAAAR
jgi:PAS domain S-box-containing protein